MNKLKTCENTLQKTRQIQQRLRERLYNAKLERKRIRSQCSDLTFQGGLLALPSLMHDYDETVEKVNAKRVTVNELKETISHLNEQISVFEARFSGSINSNFIK